MVSPLSVVKSIPSIIDDIFAKNPDIQIESVILKAEMAKARGLPKMIK